MWCVAPPPLYLPLIARGYRNPAPVVHPRTDAPDACSQATAVSLGDVYPDDFATPNDNDWYQFAAAAGETYQIATGALGARADTRMCAWRCRA